MLWEFIEKSINSSIRIGVIALVYPQAESLSMGAFFAEHYDTSNDSYNNNEDCQAKEQPDPPGHVEGFSVVFFAMIARTAWGNILVIFLDGLLWNFLLFSVYSVVHLLGVGKMYWVVSDQVMMWWVRFGGKKCKEDEFFFFICQRAAGLLLTFEQFLQILEVWVWVIHL